MRLFMDWYKALFEMFQGMILYPIRTVGPFFVALMPASFIGYSVYHIFGAADNHTAALSLAIITAVALEAIGINAIHTAVDMYGRRRYGKAAIMGLMSIVYMGVATAVVAYSDEAFPDLIHNLGMAAPWLTGIAYLATAFTEEVNRDETKSEIEAQAEQKGNQEEKTYQRELQRHQMKMEHEQNLAKIAANRDARVAKASQPSVPNVSRDTLDSGTPKEQVEAILQAVRNNPKPNMAQLARDLGIGRSTLYRRIGDMESAGTIKKNGVGYKINGEV